jgi:hypothetical protein
MFSDGDSRPAADSGSPCRAARPTGTLRPKALGTPGGCPGHAGTGGGGQMGRFGRRFVKVPTGPL